MPGMTESVILLNIRGPYLAGTRARGFILNG